MSDMATKNSPTRAVILAVDDQPRNLAMLEAIFQHYLPECLLLTAASPADGLVLATQTRLDTIILDLNMPGMDGIAMCQALKTAPATAHVPVLLLTAGAADGRMVARGLAAGADDFLAKPVDNVELAARVRVMLRIKRVEDELRALNRELEQHVETRTQQLIEAEKLTTLGTLVSGVAHEINNPCQYVLLNAPMVAKIWKAAQPILAAKAATDGDFDLAGLGCQEAFQLVPGLLAGIQHGAEHIRGVVQDLRDYVNTDADEPLTTVDLNAVVEAAVRLLQDRISKATRCFRLQCAPDLPPLQGQFRRLEQVVINLIQNACEAMTRDSGEITVVTAHDTATNRVLLVVHDEGCGIAAEHLPRLTDPFFTTRRTAGGTGLGLSIVAAAVAKHHGILHIASVAGQGTTVTVKLPPATHHEGAHAP